MARADAVLMRGAAPMRGAALMRGAARLRGAGLMSRAVLLRGVALMRGAVVVAVLVATTVACTPAAEPPTSEPTGPPPAVDFTASVTRDRDELRISYRLTNEDSAELYVLNRLPEHDGPGEVYPARDDWVYIIGRDGGTAEIAKRAFDMPRTDRVAWEAAAVIGATRLAPGEEVVEEFTVALPLTRRHPYGNDLGSGEIRLPDPVTSVVFCVGVVGEAWQTMFSTPQLPIFEHTASTTRAQHVFCSASTPLG